jgi:hypothetical protein
MKLKSTLPNLIALVLFPLISFSQIAITNTAEIAKIKEGTLFFAMKDPNLPKAAAYVEAIKKAWTFSKVECIKYTDVFPQSYKVLSIAESKSVLLFIKTPTKKFITVTNAQSGDIIYSAYTGSGANFNTSDLKELQKATQKNKPNVIFSKSNYLFSKITKTSSIR